MAGFRALSRGVESLWRSFTGAGDPVRDAIETVFQDNFDGLVVIGSDGRIVTASRIATDLLLGEGAPDVAGRDMQEVLPHSIVRAVEQVFHTGRTRQPTPMDLATLSAHETSKGLIVQYVVTLSDLGDWRLGVMRYVACLTFWDVTERRRREEELAFMGTHDPLTGALTRSELLKIVDGSLSGDRRRSSGLTMLLVDLGRFKQVNDTLGHSHGDMVLKQAVVRLRAAGMETVARLGGDVFALIRHGRLTPSETEAFCEGLIERIILPYQLGSHRALIGASIGMTHTDISGYDPETLVSHADMALSVAKALPGNNYIRFTPEMDDLLKEKQDMDAALRAAIERHQLKLTYQPQIILETGELAGVEALVRWQHPQLGIVSPDKFIPVAEETGQIVELGRWVLETACREVASWPEPIRVAVNVSPVQFELVDVVAEVTEALRKSGLEAHRLDIEITEGIFLSQSSYIIEALQRLRQLGIGIALDDFGTGYSSLSYLGRLPVDKIKIDQSFVRSLPADAEAGAIIRAVMTLSETLNKVVIAEGIENADQAWMLRMMGCKVGQGYHFGRPRTAEEMVADLAGRRAKAVLAG